MAGAKAVNAQIYAGPRNRDFIEPIFSGNVFEHVNVNANIGISDRGF
jgi:hypothetical protein